MRSFQYTPEFKPQQKQYKQVEFQSNDERFMGPLLNRHRHVPCQNHNTRISGPSDQEQGFKVKGVCGFCNGGPIFIAGAAHM